MGHVQDWLDEVHKAAGESVTKLVVGNKADLTDLRKVEEDRASQYAQSVNASFIETSAKTAVNVDKSFLIIAKQLVKKNGNQPAAAPSGIEEANTSGGECCCILL